jgi:chromate reductase
MSDEQFTIVAFSGALRKRSFNSGLLRAAQQVAPDGVTIEIHDLIDIPLYNGDVEAAGIPESVQRLADHVRAADAVLIASPEYNYGMSGVLKNALDWISRPALHYPLRHKPVAIMGASGGNWGTVRSQLQLRQTLGSMIDAYTLSKPEVMVPRASSAFDDDGNLEDDDVRERVRGLVEALVDWARRVDE